MVGWHHRLDGLEFDELRELVMDREAWHAAIHEVTRSRTRLRDFIFGAPKSLQMVTIAMELKNACSWKEKLWPT